MFGSLGLRRWRGSLLCVEDMMKGLGKLALVLGGLCLPALSVLAWQLLSGVA